MLAVLHSACRMLLHPPSLPLSSQCVLCAQCEEHPLYRSMLFLSVVLLGDSSTSTVHLVDEAVLIKFAVERGCVSFMPASEHVRLTSSSHLITTSGQAELVSSANQYTLYPVTVSINISPQNGKHFLKILGVWVIEPC